MLNNLFILVVKIYQKAISPFFISSCRFTPSCSEYTIEAIQEFGVLKGITMGMVRILKCNPLGSSGYDPIKK